MEQSLPPFPRRGWGAPGPASPLTRPRSAYSTIFSGSRAAGQPAAGGSQYPQPRAAGAVQAEGPHVQQRPKPSRICAFDAHLSPDTHHTPSRHPGRPDTSGGHGGPTDPAPCPAAAQEEPVPHGRCALGGRRGPPGRWCASAAHTRSVPGMGLRVDAGRVLGGPGYPHPFSTLAERADVRRAGDVQDSQQSHTAREGPHPGLHGRLPRWVCPARPRWGVGGGSHGGGGGGEGPGAPPSSPCPPQRTRARSRAT